ncbi:hypothetical protein [Virgibacillus ndiopensis]|uniref:hypothetical protein n=1 Tax=Virgibacillus ndiopensis TaxID=2004408 RepID=UPI001145B75E|nr:hypothetical protein [Virgibacillus ndiopensis]
MEAIVLKCTHKQGTVKHMGLVLKVSIAYDGNFKEPELDVDVAEDTRCITYVLSLDYFFVVM